MDIRLSLSTPCVDELHSPPAYIFHSGKEKNEKNIYSGILAKGNKWIDLACNAAMTSVSEGGGPFGAVVIQIDNQTNEILRYWATSNKVTQNNDPTAHAEVLAIRSACSELGVYDLGNIQKDISKLPQTGQQSHCVIYSSCEPCPMCYSAIVWARIPALYFAATRYDAAQPGVNFSDEDIYEELELPYEKRNLTVCKCDSANATKPFEAWKNSDLKTEY